MVATNKGLSSKYGKLNYTQYWNQQTIKPWLKWFGPIASDLIHKFIEQAKC